MLSSRLSFGLNFERYSPEAVELRSVQCAGTKLAELELLDDPKEQCTAALDDLIALAEF